MSKTITGGAVLVIIVLAIVAYSFSGGDSMMQKDDAMMQQDEMTKTDAVMMNDSVEKDTDAMMNGGMKNETGAMMENDSAMMADAMAKKGSYEPYAATKLSAAQMGDAVLFFRASWCPTCKALESDIRAHVESIPVGLTILDVDYDNSAELKKKYGVTYQHTFVQVSTDGTQIKKWSGSPTLVALVAEVQ